MFIATVQDSNGMYMYTNSCLPTCTDLPCQDSGSEARDVQVGAAGVPLL